MNKDGYWNSSHIKIQLEDIIYCLLVLFPDFDYKCLFDQSSGHCKVRGDGLVVNNMNSNYGGKASIMRDTIINKIGEYSSLLTAGDKQCMNYMTNDIGPFWMDEETRLVNKNDGVTTDVIVREKSKAKLLIDLRSSGIDTTK